MSRSRETPPKKGQIRQIVAEVLVYAFLVACFVTAILKSPAAGYLARLARGDRPVYAAVALGLMIVQGFVLELLARGILALIGAARGKRS